MYLGLDALLVIVLSFFGFTWVINSQFAFISSLLITYTTYFSYKRMVEHRLQSGAYTLEDDRDEWEKEDDEWEGKDEFDLPLEEQKDFKTIVQEEKAKQKGFFKKKQNILGSIGSAMVPYRLIAYAVLFILFLVLLRREIFAVLPFMLGLSVVPLGSILAVFLKDKTE